MNKKGFKSHLHWPEVLGIIVMVFGFAFALIAKSAIISYVLIIISGAVFGLILFHHKNTFKLALALITVFFLIGFLIGNFYGNRIVTIVLFIIALITSYQLAQKR